MSALRSGGSAVSRTLPSGSSLALDTLDPSGSITPCLVSPKANFPSPAPRCGRAARKKQIVVSLQLLGGPVMAKKVLSVASGFLFTPAGMAVVMLGFAGTIGRAADAATAATTVSTPTTATKKIIRIRAGSSEAFTDSSGNVWEGERGFEGGQTIDRDPSATIANTKDAGLYLTEHYSMGSFSCVVPSGKYTAKLHFAETYNGITGPGQRVFSFNVQGKAFKDFDIWVKAGGLKKAYVETVPVEVTNGTFKITFTPQVANPMINAIEIHPAEAQPVLRMTAGRSTPFKDSQGNLWEAEKGFEGGATIERDPSMTIANTKDPELFTTEHYSMDSFSCAVPNGKYTAKLWFAETFDGISGPGQRVFSFNVQGKAFNDFDIWVKAGGPKKAYVETVPVEITDGTFKITFTPNIENPMINAIEIYPADPR